MKRFTPIVICLAFLLTACGGGGASSSGSTWGSLPPTRPAGTVSGVAFDGVVSGGTVSIYDFSSGARGDLLGSGQTGTDGRFAISIVSSDTPILIEVRRAPTSKRLPACRFNSTQPRAKNSLLSRCIGRANR